MVKTLSQQLSFELLILIILQSNHIGFSGQGRRRGEVQNLIDRSECGNLVVCTQVDSKSAVHSDLSPKVLRAQQKARC